MSYDSVVVRYERRLPDDGRGFLQPVRYRKEWVTYKNCGRNRTDLVRFITTRVTEVGFPRPDHSEAPVEPWRSCAPTEATRASLIASGLIRPAGDGQKYLPLEGPA